MLRISEAARKIGGSLDERYPAVEFPTLRQLGSVLRHDYDEVDADMLRRAVMEKLDGMEAARRRELTS